MTKKPKRTYTAVGLTATELKTIQQAAEDRRWPPMSLPRTVRCLALIGAAPPVKG
jgi:hypothetical protein